LFLVEHDWTQLRPYLADRAPQKKFPVPLAQITCYRDSNSLFLAHGLSGPKGKSATNSAISGVCERGIAANFKKFPDKQGIGTFGDRFRGTASAATNYGFDINYE